MDQVNKTKLMIWNAQGICKKKFEFFDFLKVNSIDVSLVSETHLLVVFRARVLSMFLIVSTELMDNRVGVLRSSLSEI